MQVFGEEQVGEDIQSLVSLISSGRLFHTPGLQALLVQEYFNPNVPTIMSGLLAPGRRSQSEDHVRLKYNVVTLELHRVPRASTHLF